MSREILETEHWRPVVGYESRYEVSTRGRVRALFWSRGATDKSLPRPVGIAGHRKRREYARVALFDGTGRRRYRGIHVLVLEAFAGTPPTNGVEVRHLNGDCTDNRLGNLAWGTHRENGQDMVRHGTARGGRPPRLTAGQVRAIRRLAMTDIPQRHIARLMGIDPSTVSQIKHRRRWARLA